MNNFNEQLYEMIGRLRQKGLNQPSSRSKAAAVIKPPCDMIVSDNPNWDKTGKAGSTQTQTQYQTVVTKYNMGGSSTGEPVYQCGTHDFETRSIQEFNNHISKIHGNESNSRAASMTAHKNKAKEIYDFITSNGRI